MMCFTATESDVGASVTFREIATTAGVVCTVFLVVVVSVFVVSVAVVVVSVFVSVLVFVVAVFVVFVVAVFVVVVVVVVGVHPEWSDFGDCAEVEGCACVLTFQILSVP